MINWKNLTLAGALTILPWSTYAMALQPEVNPTQETNSMRHIAQGFKHGGKGNPGEKMDRVLQQLDLTPEQSQQISSIRQESETVTEDLHQQLETKHQEMKDLMMSDADADTIRAQFQETQNLRQQMGNNRFETMLGIREVLTSEQRAELAELMEQHRGGRRGM